MTPVFAKLNFKDSPRLLAIDPPQTLERELAALRGPAIDRRPQADTFYGFAIGFATTRAELDRVSEILTAATAGDAVVWVAYPKKTSKRYRCEFDRDSSWDILGAAGFEAVRMVAIDADWSALRFRRVEYIKRMTRAPSRASSAAGKARVSKASS